MTEHAVADHTERAVTEHGTSEHVDPAVAGLLAQVRRRLRAAWGLAWVQVLAPAVAVAALLLVLAGWVFPWPWTDWLAAGAAVAAVVGIIVAAFVVPVPLGAAARAADRGLGTKDVLATSLEVPPDGEFGRRVHARAREASSGRARDAVRVRLGGWRLAMSGVLGLGALALALTHNPQDDARERRARERAAVGAVADELAAEARTLATSPAALDQAVAAELGELAEALRDAGHLDPATELLSRAEEELAGQVGGDLLARKAATQGLERALTDDPLSAGEERDAADQLRDVAETVDGLAPSERDALAERLEQLAGAQARGAPEVAEALQAAAGAVQAGDAADAAAALDAAANAQEASAQAVDQQEAAAEAAARAGEARAALEQAAASRDGQSQTDGRGQGEGQQGEGQDPGVGQGAGQGDGQGQGEGPGQGQGQGGQGGSPSGPVAGGGSGSGGQGQGGAGQPTGGSGGAGDEPVTGSVFDPPSFTEGEELNAGGGTGTGDGQTVGAGDGPTAAGAGHVPVAEVIDRYAREAITALDRPGVPPSVRDLVREYFAQLSGGG